LKTNIAPYPAGLNEVLALKPVSYQWNELSGMDRDGRYTGFLAQDVAAVLPHATGVDGRGFLSLNDRAIVAALVNGMQEQEKTIAALRHRLAALENQS
jgi:hypothetical protein